MVCYRWVIYLTNIYLLNEAWPRIYQKCFSHKIHWLINFLPQNHLCRIYPKNLVLSGRSAML